jgi:hypothetical protein
MLRYLRLLDDGLIDRVFQPASDWAHDWTGKNSIDQVQWSYRLSGLAWAGSCGWSMAHGESWAIDAFLAFASITSSFHHSAEEWSIRHYAQNGLPIPPSNFFRKDRILIHLPAYHRDRSSFLVVECCPGNDRSS